MKNYKIKSVLFDPRGRRLRNGSNPPDINQFRRHTGKNLIPYFSLIPRTGLHSHTEIGERLINHPCPIPAYTL